jgi:hypothetical protein
MKHRPGLEWLEPVEQMIYFLAMGTSTKMTGSAESRPAG